MSSGAETPGVTRVYMEFVKYSCTLTQLLEKIQIGTEENEYRGYLNENSLIMC